MQKPGDKHNPDALLDDLHEHATQLLDVVKKGDMEAASAIIHMINDARDETLYAEIGRLTRGLHEAIVNFNIEPAASALPEEQRSEIVDARDNLSYVIKLTQKSADKTMDMVEEGLPISTKIADDARELKSEWLRLKSREMDKGEFKDLSNRIEAYLDDSIAGGDALNAKLNEILLAQDFQDLTGQVIKRVIDLVQDVESNLVNLMRIAGKVDQMTGNNVIPEGGVKPKLSSKDVAAEGPIINASERANVVSSQDEVDDLLSSLGF